MTRFSANLGFLWRDLSTPDAIRAASAAGFDAVECHWPYDDDPISVRTALDDTAMTMIGLNTARGSRPGDAGLAAMPGRSTEARELIDQAVSYADDINAKYVHVMAGRTSGHQAHDTFVDNLRYAAELTARSERIVVIEPLNHVDTPHYFLHTNRQAAELIRQVDRPNVRLMFDCYHSFVTEGQVLAEIETHFGLIGHVQCASALGRAEPRTATGASGDIDYGAVFSLLTDLGWSEPIGAEYVPSGALVEDTLGWMSELR